jgi:hypothetical protein
MKKKLSDFVLKTIKTLPQLEWTSTMERFLASYSASPIAVRRTFAHKYKIKGTINRLGSRSVPRKRGTQRAATLLKGDQGSLAVLVSAQPERPLL